MCLDSEYFNTLEENWTHYSEEEKNQIIDTLIKQDYHLNSETPLFLRMNQRFVLESLKQDIACAQYIPEEMKQESGIFKFLALHNYYAPWQIKRFTLDKILDKEIMDCFFSKLDSYGNDNPIYRERVCDFFQKALHSFPSIATFHKIFDIVIEEAWRKHKHEYREKYENIFAKICSYLRNNNTVSDFEQFGFGSEIKNVLGEKNFLELSIQMEEYMQIYHSDDEQKMEKLQPSKDMISKFSSLYVSKCKELYKKRKMDDCYEFLKTFYKLDLSNPIVYNKVSHYCKKRKFKDIYRFKQSANYDFMREMEKKYQEQYQVDLIFIHTSIHHFVVYDLNNFEEVFPIGKKYFSYLNYKKCMKLIHRLNSNYIKYEDSELNSYRYLIQLDEKTNQYVYVGESFSEEQIATYEKYNDQKKVFYQIKKDLSIRIDELDLQPEEIEENDISRFSSFFPLTEEYFKFDFNYSVKYLDIQNFIRIMLNDGDGLDITNFLNDISYQKMYEILIDSGIFWLRLMLSIYRVDFLYDYGFHSNSMTTFINNMNKIVSLSNTFQIDISNVEQFLLFQKMIDVVDRKALTILKPNTILKLLECLEFTSDNKEKILSVALNLVSHMVSRGDSTVPYIEGKYLDYQYSLYDALDEEILLAGINTDACFKCCGNDNDFLHYCALNKNGFVLKITDSTSNFIGRASGFRYGNCIFFNQLRTIYDQNGNHYFGTYSEEQNDIIGTFQKACDDIIRLSQSNEKEKTPIDYVFVNKSYALSNYPLYEIYNLQYAFGSDPMDIVSPNWLSFIKNTKNLQESEIDSGFYTDYGCYSIICMASSNLPGAVTDNFNFVDVEPLYQRKRNGVVVTKDLTTDLISKINRTKAIHAFLAEEELELVREEDGDLFAVGDNWYLIYKNHQIIDQCVLLEDRIACIEAKMTEEEISKNTEYFCDGKIKIYQK